MARPQKNNVDYFSHDTGMRNHRKIKAIRMKFGIEGYAIRCMLLEHLGSCEHLASKWDEIEVEMVAGDFGVSASIMQEVVSYCIRLDLLQLESEVLRSQSFIDRLQPLLDKRKKERKGVIASKSPHSKVKEKKEEKTKEKETTDILTQNISQKKEGGDSETVGSVQTSQTLPSSEHPKEKKEKSSAKKEKKEITMKRSIINKHNRAGAIALYDVLKTHNNGIVDGTLDDCAYLLAKIKRIEGLAHDPPVYLDAMIQAMIASGMTEYYSISNPSKLCDKLGDIINRLTKKSQKLQASQRQYGFH